MFFISMAVLFAHAGVFCLVWLRFYSGVIPDPFYGWGDVVIVLLYAVLFHILARVYGGYRIGDLRVSEIIYSQVLVIVFGNVVAYCQICLLGRQMLSPLPLMVMSAAQVAYTVLWAYAANRLYFKLFPSRRMIMIYGSQAATRLIYKMSKRYDKYLICAVVSSSESFENIIERIAPYEAVVLCDVRAEVRNQILKYCYGHSIRVYMTPNITDIIIGGADKIHLFDTPLYLCRNNGLAPDQRMLKRAMDLLISIPTMLLLSPLMLAIAAAIKIEDGGPVFFRQKRLTRDGKEFLICKFRSMRENAEEDGVARLATRHDDRITRVGSFLRRTRLDELPQLLNVIRGEMSIIGPRPERPEIARQYEQTMPEFNYRLRVKAGLTGYAQILGKYNTIPYDKLKLDLLYIERYSLLLDLKILLMTVKVLFIPESSEGIEDGTLTPEDGLGLFSEPREKAARRKT